MEALVITHNNLPEGINYLIQLVSELKSERSSHQLEDKWMDLDELCSYRPDKPSKSTVYAEVSHKKIPVHKRSKKLMFLKSEIDKWLMDCKKLTAQEIKNNANEYLKK